MALLSPRLETLVLCGEASLRTLTVGRSGLSVLRVPQDRTFIIVEFDYQHFIDFTDVEDLDEVLSRSVHQLSFKSGKSVNLFVIRDSLNIVNFMGQLGTRPSVSGDYHKETYLIHNEDIQIQIISAPPVVGTVSTAGVSPKDLNPLNPPNGYGTGASGIVQTVNEEYPGGIGEYLPESKKYTAPVAATPFLTSEQAFPVDVVTALNPTNTVDEFGQRSYPIVNISYVDIRRNIAEELASSG